MSRVYVPVANVGKAHAADIYSLSITPLHTITASRRRGTLNCGQIN